MPPPGPLRTRVEEVREYFVLDDLRVLASTLSSEQRRTLRRDTRLAKQTRRAARALFRCGHHAEAMRLARTLVENVAAVVDDVTPAVADIDGARKELAVVRALLDPERLPRFDDEVARAHGVLLEGAVSTAQSIGDAFAPLSMSEGDIRRTRFLRRAMAVALVFAGIIGAYFAIRPSRKLHATASASWSDAYGPARAVDGDPKTEWLPPDRSSAFLEVTFHERTARRLRLLNVRNAPHENRATVAVHADAFDRGVLVRSVDGAFPGYRAVDTWLELDLGGVKTDRIRVSIVGWELAGGGLAEVEVE